MLPCPHRYRLAVLDKNDSLVDRLRTELAPQFQVLTGTGDPEDALEVASGHSPDVMLVDLDLGGLHRGARVLRSLSAEHPEIVTVAMSHTHDVSSMLAAQAAGARALIPRPLDVPDLNGTLTHFLQHEDRAAFHRRATPDHRTGELWTFQPTAPGVGQTTLIRKAATSLARRGRSVLVVDLAPDPAAWGPTLSQLASLEIPPRAAILASQLPEITVGEGHFRFLPASYQHLAVGMGADPQRAIGILLALADVYDYVLVDVCFLLRRQWEGLAPFAQRTLLVTDDSQPAMKRFQVRLSAWADETWRHYKRTPVLIRRNNDAASLRSFGMSLPKRGGIVAASLPQDQEPQDTGDSAYDRALSTLLAPMVGRNETRGYVAELAPPPPPSQPSLLRKLAQLITKPPSRPEEDSGYYSA